MSQRWLHIWSTSQGIYCNNSGSLRKITYWLLDDCAFDVLAEMSSVIPCSRIFCCTVSQPRCECQEGCRVQWSATREVIREDAPACGCNAISKSLLKNTVSFVSQTLHFKVLQVCHICFNIDENKFKWNWQKMRNDKHWCIKKIFNILFFNYIFSFVLFYYLLIIIQFLLLLI